MGIVSPHFLQPVNKFVKGVQWCVSASMDCSCAWKRKVSVDKEERGIFGEDGNLFFTNSKLKTITSRV